jgi:lipid-A-disaccharide synthase
LPLTEIMVVAGEASGDQHAAALVAEIQRRRPDIHFFGMGGPRLAACHADLLYSASEVSVMGIVEVLPKLWRILSVKRGLERAAARRRPACAVLVDIPDFNLRLARALKRLGIPVIYYISPMLWAWRRGRIRQVEAFVDRMLCILPFEEAYYRRAGIAALYVGSPVLEQVPAAAPAPAFRKALALPVDRPTLALLPGSRPSEVRRILPALVGAALALTKETPQLQLVVPVAPGLDRELISVQFARAGLTPHLLQGHAPEAVGASDVAVVASGTATLEAGLMLRPLVVVYRVALISEIVGRLLLRVAHVSLINLLAGRAIVPELLQRKMTPARIAAEVKRLWRGPARDETVLALEGLRGTLGDKGAAARAAAAVLEWVRSTPLG